MTLALMSVTVQFPMFTYSNVSTGNNPLGVIPSTSDLLDANIRQFETVGDDHGSPLSSHDNQPISVSHDRPSNSSLVLLGKGLPGLIADLIKQIQKEEYIDFAELPPCKGDTTTTLPKSMEGQVVLLDLQDVAKSKCLPPDFQTWAQCFGIYTAAVSQVCPGRILMAYQMKIARYSLKCQWPLWVVYDMNFRQKKALIPGLSWAITDGGLYSECFTSMRRDCTEAWNQICHSLDHASTVCPMAPPTPRIRKSKPSQGNHTKLYQLQYQGVHLQEVFLPAHLLKSPRKASSEILYYYYGSTRWCPDVLTD